MKIVALLFAGLTLATISVLWVLTIRHHGTAAPIQAAPMAAREGPKAETNRGLVSDRDRVERLLAELQLEQPRLKAKRRIAFHYSCLVGGLISIAGTEKERYVELSDPRQIAVELLGEFRCLDAIPTLIEHIEWQQSMSITDNYEFAGYPCAMALSRYGIAAVPAILTRVRTGPVSDREIDLFARLIRSAYEPMGGDDEAISTVERTIDRATQIDNLERLLHKLEELTRAHERRRERAKSGPAAA
ncbi:MAG: hypothetical protein WD847_08620 [Pirellulales bacterium]